jgi:hypothetical protein
LITVRLSLSEHEQLKNSCAEDGGRSISDFVREVLIQRLAYSNGYRTGVLMEDLSSIVVKLEELDFAMKEISVRISELLGRDRTEGDTDGNRLES